MAPKFAAPAAPTNDSLRFRATVTFLDRWPYFAGAAALLLAAIILLAPRLVAAPEDSHSSGQKLDAGVFEADYPDGWTMHEIPNLTDGAAYVIASTPKKYDLQQGIPPEGEVGVTVLTVPIDKVPSEWEPYVGDIRTLAGKVARIPKTAKDPKVVQPLHPRFVDDRSGITGTFMYEFEGRPIYQKDVVMIQSRTLIAVEIDTDMTRANEADEILEDVLDSWHWTDEPLVPNPPPGPTDQSVS